MSNKNSLLADKDAIKHIMALELEMGDQIVAEAEKQADELCSQLAKTVNEIEQSNEKLAAAMIVLLPVVLAVHLAEDEEDEK